MAVALQAFDNRLSPQGINAPTGKLLIDYSHPLARDVAFCAVLKDGRFIQNLVDGNVATGGSTAADAMSPPGPGILFPATDNGKADFGIYQPTTAATFTVLVLANPAASASQHNSLFNQRNNSTGAQWNMIANADKDDNSNSGFFTFYLEASVASFGAQTASGVDGNYHVFIGRLNGTGAGSATAWIDGINGTTNTSTANSGGFNDSGQRLVIGGLGDLVIDQYAAACTITLAMAWNRALSDDEIVYISANPFSFLVSDEGEMPALFLVTAGGTPVSVLGIPRRWTIKR